MKLIVGLGNPGEEYEGTRHNVGFDLAEKLAERHGLSFEPLRVGWLKKRLGEWALDRKNGFAILKPLTFMNRSGEAVVEAAKRLEVLPQDILALSDDFALSVGVLRIRREGSSGGQKGLQSLIDALGTQDFPRLRVGIGEARGEAARHVLTKFSKAERAEVENAYEKAVEALELWLKVGDIERCMNEFNKRSS